MEMRFTYIKNNGYLCIEIFETMQSSVTRSRTSITKSLPASFKLSIFTLFSESYSKIHCSKVGKHYSFFIYKI